MANVQWVGNDGNRYVADGSGTRSVGPATAQGGQYWINKGYSMQLDPNSGKSTTDQLVDANANWIERASSPNTVSTGTGSNAGADNTAQIAQYDQGIGNLNTSLGRLDTDLNVGYGNADNTYNTSLNRLLQSEADNKKVYEQNVSGTKKDYVGSKNTINSQTGASLNSLQRLLGSRGAGGSSAALIAAPEAAARQGTLQRQGVGDAFGKNIQALDTGWGNYAQDVTNEKTDLEKQKEYQRNQTLAGVNQNRASLLQQLAQLVGQKTSLQGGDAVGASQGYLDQANNYLSEASRLGATPAVAQRAPSVYKAPELASYTVNPNAAPTVNGQAPASTDYASPFLSLLLGKRNEQRNLLGA